MGNRCTGHCCKRFFLPLNYELLQEAYRAKLKGEQQTFREVHNFFPGDVETIAPMVIPLQDGYFTCKHLKENGDCAIYETRPDMCREFPYGRQCSIAGCTWDEAKQLKPTQLPELKVLYDGNSSRH